MLNYILNDPATLRIFEYRSHYMLLFTNQIKVNLFVIESTGVKNGNLELYEALEDQCLFARLLFSNRTLFFFFQINQTLCSVQDPKLWT